MANEKKSTKKVINVKENANNVKSIIECSTKPIESNEIITTFLGYLDKYRVLIEFYKSIDNKMISDGFVKMPVRKIVKFKHATYYKEGGFELDKKLADALDLLDFKRYNAIQILLKTIKTINKLGTKIIGTGYRYFRLILKSYLSGKDIDYTYFKSSFHIFNYERNYDKDKKIDSLRIIVLPYYDTDTQADVSYRLDLINEVFGSTKQEFIDKLVRKYSIGGAYIN